MFIPCALVDEVAPICRMRAGHSFQLQRCRVARCGESLSADDVHLRDAGPARQGFDEACDATILRVVQIRQDQRCCLYRLDRWCPGQRYRSAAYRRVSSTCLKPTEDPPDHPGGQRVPRRWPPLFMAWPIALLATAGALFLGEVMGMTPCVLCWYQRIAMFPLALILGVGLLGSDARCVRYTLPLAWAGWGIAVYHCLIFWGVVAEGLVPCGKGSSCADADLQVGAGSPYPCCH